MLNSSLFIHKSQLESRNTFLNTPHEMSFTSNINSVSQSEKSVPNKVKSFIEMSFEERQEKLNVAQKIAEQVNKSQLPKLSYPLKADILPSRIISQSKTEPAKPLEREKTQLAINQTQPKPVIKPKPIIKPSVFVNESPKKMIFPKLILAKKVYIPIIGQDINIDSISYTKSHAFFKKMQFSGPLISPTKQTLPIGKNIVSKLRINFENK
ncbi:TPA: hypothetical protein ACS78C_002641 [Providencia alcalifaciens]|uniref:hypothetical protein n=1 Tax=Providencia alcalifaciens TaxID=126385 RepID=UPI0012B524CE|nr:hypothetical protein [Providencia alcalifaciens]MTC39808.1 hypothetical protein [Providencia alcalifaciens]